ncbi:MAG: LemA family protein, LemA protein [Candidatus Peregrinibacteria bacterium GW2011_GWE2_39_6]|nr:MAG: LemA family protein, LemA protein [Candidatus Peregrinibacteria bacterium GW2011_GWE2_39_6]
MQPLTIALIVVGVLFLALIGLYNGLVRARVRVKEAWSYMTHEREVLENVTKTRTAAIQGKGSPEQQAKNENMLSGALKSLFAVAENYPDLKANQNFLDLQNELTDTEDKIQASRRFYNGNVRVLNTKIQVFPSNLMARIFGFKEETFFEIENEAEREVVKVDFSNAKNSPKETSK